eukprot:NODE_965_length_2669_cov_11.974036.p1 GENE.NODE_965_length_2669_cov_11.974036~~NODE_965_length_2669_cov_11.974036.p1  ORF type:complete len:710 (+),score=138.91 NODE_965_length_2669_cov_11.974036:71-2200(+)
MLMMLRPCFPADAAEVCKGVSPCFAPPFSYMVEEREAQLLQLQEKLMSEFVAFQDARNPVEDCYGADTCALTTPGINCSVAFGDTQGCSCEGRAISLDSLVYKFVPGLADSAKKNQICWSQTVVSEMQDLYQSSDSALKWIYAGMNDGTIINYPGFIWGGWEETAEEGYCSGSYDVRLRPWYIAGASGSKNVVLIIDTSGSMDSNNRISAAQLAAASVIDGLSHADFLNVMTFSTHPDVKNTVMVPATEYFRDQMKTWINSRIATGFTNYGLAFSSAFDILERSFETSVVDVGCHTAIIFLTDGNPTDDLSDAINTFINRRSSSTVSTIRAARLAVYGVGSGVSIDTLKTLACSVDGIYEAIDDGNTEALKVAMSSYYRMFEISSMLHPDSNGIKWSEPYMSIPDIWGSMVTAVVPLYDPNGDAVASIVAQLPQGSNVTPSSLVGVAAVDLPLCELIAAAEATGWVSSVESEVESTKLGCNCLSSYSWEGKTYTSCTMDDYSVPWCGTPSGCGMCNPDVFVDPSGCWDECVGSGPVEYQLGEFLRLRSLEQACPVTLEDDILDPCALEGLRGTGATCGTEAATPCDDSDLAEEWSSMYGLRNPYSDTVSYTLYTNDAYAPVVSESAPAPCGDAITDTTECGTCNEGLVGECSLEICQEERQASIDDGTFIEAEQYCSAFAGRATSAIGSAPLGIRSVALFSSIWWAYAV